MVITITPKTAKIGAISSKKLSRSPRLLRRRGTQGPGIGANGDDAGGGVGGQSPPPPIKSYYGHPKSAGAQGP